jgi:hypothetical protein
MSHLLEKRVAQLEKNLRLYRYCFIILMVLGTGGMMMSFNNRNSKSAPDVIQAKAFQVVDDRNNVLVELNKEDGNGQISTFTPKGKKLVSLFTSEGGGGGLNTYDNDGEVIFKVTRTTEGGGYMALFNSALTEVAEWGVTDAESGYFRLNDKKGDKLAWMTYTADGGGYFSLSNEGKEMFRLSTPDVGGRMGVYNSASTRIAYIGTQDSKDGNITVWNNGGTRLGSLPN